MADSWAVKYRPQIFSDLTGNEANARILREAVKRNQTPPAIFLAGTRGSGKCVDKNTLLLTDKGIQYAKDVFPSGIWEPDTFIDYKCNLVNMNGDFEETSHAYYNGVSDCVSITSSAGFNLVCTYNHPIYVYEIWSGEFKWKKAGEIDEAFDYVTIPQKLLNTCNDIEKILPFDLEDCRLYSSDIDGKSYVTRDYYKAQFIQFSMLLCGTIMSITQRDDGYYVIKPVLLSLINSFYIDIIESVDVVKGVETVDFTLPETHSFITNGLISHNTTSARIYAKAICCEHPTPEGEPCNECDTCKDITEGSYPDVIELDAASENSVQGIRDLIKSLSYLPTRGDKKLVIIDECLTADTLVLDGNGIPRNISSYSDGAVVCSNNGGILCSKSISNCFSRESEVLQVKSFFDSVTGTPTHRMLVYSDGVVDYKMLKDVKLGDSFVLPKKLLENQTNIHNPILGELLGIVLSDGLLTPYCIQINVTKSFKIEYLDSRLEQLVKSIDPSCRCNFSYDKRGSRLYRIYSKNLINLLQDYGICLGAKQDKLYLDEKIFMLDRESRLMCFWAYTFFDGANLPRTSKGIEVDGACTNLIRGFNLLLHQMGVLGIFKLRSRTLKGKVCLPMGYLRFAGPSLYDLVDITNQELQDKSFLELLYKRFEKAFTVEKLESSYKYRSTVNPQPLVEGYSTDNYIFSKVYDISEAGVQQVYDFTVEDTHNFIANGLISSNCHSLSQAANNALLKTLEEPPEFVRFVFCTTEPEKVLETIRSRCLMFRFNDITTRDIATRLKFIAQQENVPIDDAALTVIAKNSNGGMRDSIMLLEQAYLANVSNETIKPANILELVGSVSIRDIQALFMAIKSGDHNQLLTWLDEQTFAPIDILNSSISFLETVILIKQGVSPAEFVSKDLVAGVMSLASTISFHDVSVMFEEFRGIIYDLRSLNGVSSSALFKLRMLGVVDKLTYQPVMNGQVAMSPQTMTFLQKVKQEFNVERIPLPM